MKLRLTDAEKRNLRSQKIKIKDLEDYAADELEVILNVPKNRAQVIYAMIEFQKVPSIGEKFAEDLIFMGYYKLEDLKDKDGSKLFDEFELKKGYWLDSCIEDQFRLAVHYARNRDSKKVWWDFTKERKKYRLENGFAANRPGKAWYEDEAFRKER